MAYHPGFPDFLLLYERKTIYAEVKWLPDVPRPKQMLFLQEMHDEGHPTCLLGYSKPGPIGYWTVWHGGYTRLIGTTLREYEGSLTLDSLDDPNMLGIILG